MRENKSKENGVVNGLGGVLSLDWLRKKVVAAEGSYELKRIILESAH